MGNCNLVISLFHCHVTVDMLVMCINIFYFRKLSRKVKMVVVPTSDTDGLLISNSRTVLLG